MMTKLTHALALAVALFPAALLPAAASGAGPDGGTESRPAPPRPVVEVAFVLDTTGSMARLIEGAKQKIWSIATAIMDTNPEAEVRMGLVAYRDIGDEYVTRIVDLTADTQDFYAQLLELKARGGGDWPESVNEALHAGVTKMAWTKGAKTDRIVFLVGDAPPQMKYEQDVKYPETIRMARERGIVINAVQAGTARDTERVWREIAQLGEGRYIPIPQSGGQIVVIETPYDVEIIELQRRINGTVIPYGPRTQRSRVEQKTAQLAAAPAPVASDMAGYLSRRAASAAPGEAITGGGDLVADVTAGRQALGAVKDDELPDALRAMSAQERQAHVHRQAKERKALNERMAELVRKRDGHVQEQRKNAPRTADSFDRAVAETLRAQVKR